jgi:IS30 family transposase
MSYTHLKTDERLELYKLRVIQKLSFEEIGPRMHRSASPLSRELRRNAADAGLYLPDTAQQKQQPRRQTAKTRFQAVGEEILTEIKTRLEQCHSPAQISGSLKRVGKASISHETIYQVLDDDYPGLGRFHQYLRQARSRRKPRKAPTANSGGIIHRVGIENRPVIADAKTKIGHWESDTIIGGNHLGVIVTHGDKASKYLVAGLGRNKTAEVINQVTLGLFSEIRALDRKTMTFDNGKEFSGHATIAKALGVQCFFARPYHSWERGLNEHTNGLLRQFFPKGTNFKITKPVELQRAVDLINHRPRKSLDYRTPHEVFYKHTSDSVALQI